jgi:hypothetical protein
MQASITAQGHGILHSETFFSAESGQKWQISTAFNSLSYMLKNHIRRGLRDVCATPPGKAPPEGASDPFEH